MIEIVFALLLSGQATVIDGDTLDIAGQRVRLHGIDAAETKQWCTDHASKPYACGIEAKEWLTWLLNKATVICIPKAGKDRYGRILAVCATDGIDINGWMVGRGLAMAYVAYSLDYLHLELDAERRKIGLWRGTFTPPWVWRRERREKK